MTDNEKDVVEGLRLAGDSLFDNAADLIESVSAELEQVKRERDAAVKDLRTFTEPCRACAHVGSNDICHECRFELIEGHHITRTGWQWRGVKEEKDE